jgi:protein phosphatase
MTEIVLPAGALVVLIGISGSGKSTFAERHFPATVILSSDAFRAMVADDPADQRASAAAFELLHLAARRRLERRRLTVVDATSVTRPARHDLVAIARDAGRPAVAIVIDPPLAVCLIRNDGRAGRRVDPAVIARQAAELEGWLAGPGPFRDEGFTAVHRIVDPDEVAAVTVGAVTAGRTGRAGTPRPRPGTLHATLDRRSDDRRTAR